MKIRTFVLVLLLGGLGVPVQAQDPAVLDSLRDRLERAERLIDVLQTQVAEQTESQVEPGAGGRLELFGLVLLNGFHTTERVNNSDVPLWVLPPDPPGGLPPSTTAATLRQTRIGLRAFQPDVLGGDFSGEIEFNLFGGQLGNGRLASLVALRRVRAELRWENGWLLFGQERLPISDVNPSSIAALEFPGFTAAGNLWFWLPQVRVGVEGGGVVKGGFEVAVIAPFGPPAQPQGISTQPNRAERSGRPFFQGRVLARWGDPELLGGEVSIGGHLGWVVPTEGDSLLVSKGAGFTARFFATQYVEIRTEAYAGELMNTLGGGAIGQPFGVGGVPVRSKGGWFQANLLPTAEWEVGGGVGIDDPDNADLNMTTHRLKNVTWETHLIWRPHPLLFGAELRRWTTSYGDPAVGDVSATQFVIGTGFVF